MNAERENEKLKLVSYTLAGTAGAVAVGGVLTPIVSIAIGQPLSTPEQWSTAAVMLASAVSAVILFWHALLTLEYWID